MNPALDLCVVIKTLSDVPPDRQWFVVIMLLSFVVLFCFIYFRTEKRWAFTPLIKADRTNAAYGETISEDRLQDGTFNFEHKVNYSCAGRWKHNRHGG